LSQTGGGDYQQQSVLRKNMADIVYTIGHSTHPLERFIALLQRHEITAIADVRSKPYSRMNPQFNREELKVALRAQGMAYVFLGKELGARSGDPSCYHEGKVQYGRLARTDLFQQGLERVREGAQKHRIALMCAEKEPLDCHRAILVARHIVAQGMEVRHILGDGRLEEHAELMARLVRQLNLPQGDMFAAPEEVTQEAYRLQEDRIAYDTGANAAGTEAVRSAAG
jgi:uncharacterized protein (DUF488 family)